MPNRSPRPSRARIAPEDGGIRLSRQEVIMRAKGYIGQAHAARHMGVTDEQIRKLIKGGKIASIQVGGRIYVTVMSLKAYYGPMAEELLAPDSGAEQFGPGPGPGPGPSTGPVMEPQQVEPAPCPPGMKPKKQCVPNVRGGQNYPQSNIPPEFQTPNPTKRGGR